MNNKIYVAAVLSAMMIAPTSHAIDWQTADGALQVKVFGFLQGDIGHVEEDTTSYKRRATLRRSRLVLEGKIFHDVEYALHADIGSNDITRITHAYLSHRFIEKYDVRVGQSKEPFSMDFLTSGSQTAFIERASINTFAPKFSMGVQTTIPYDAVTLKAGVFTGNLNNRDNDEESRAVTGRLTVAPIKTANEVLHLGIAGSYRTLNEDTRRVGFGSRPDITITSVNSVGTGSITNAEQQRLYGVEGAYQQGRLVMQGQYVGTTVERDDIVDPTFDGYYIHSVYSLTGEQKPYQQRAGVFGDIKPARPITQDGWGAWEIAARYSRLDLNDRLIQGGSLETVMAGVNWYPVDWVKLVLNASYSNVERLGETDEPTFIGGRLQVAF